MIVHIYQIHLSLDRKRVCFMNQFRVNTCKLIRALERLK